MISKLSLLCYVTPSMPANEPKYRDIFIIDISCISRRPIEHRLSLKVFICLATNAVSMFSASSAGGVTCPPADGPSYGTNSRLPGRRVLSWDETYEIDISVPAM